MLPRAGLAERKRQVVRAELSDAALALIAQQGFDETTVDQIVTAAGVSRRTFFRYFRSKEDVIVTLLSDLGAGVCAELAERPRRETCAVALRHAFEVFVEALAVHPDKTRRLTALTLTTPALVARYLESQHRWRSDLTQELARRAGVDPVVDLRPMLVAAVSLATFDTALGRWVASDDPSALPELVDQAFRHVAPALRL